MKDHHPPGCTNGSALQSGATALASVHSYSDPEDCEAAYKAAEVELTPVTGEPFEMRVARLELGDLWLAQVEESTARIKWVLPSPKRKFIRFLTGPSAGFIINGTELKSNELALLGQAPSYCELTTGPVSWAAMSLSVEVATDVGIALNGFDVFAQQGQWKITPLPEKLMRLQQLHADATTVATVAPHTLCQPEVVRSIEQSLIAGMFSCLRDRNMQKPSLVRCHHEVIMRRFRKTLESNPERALYLPEICAAIHVPERTLRACCQEQIGMSPMRYLQLRRMHLAHRALRSAAPEQTTVTEVATEFGFWHFSRFAANYRQLFGEAPSATLNRNGQRHLN